MNHLLAELAELVGKDLAKRWLARLKSNANPSATQPKAKPNRGC